MRDITIVKRDGIWRKDQFNGHSKEGGINIREFEEVSVHMRLTLMWRAMKKYHNNNNEKEQGNVY